MASPSRVAVDEAAAKINGEWSWLYTTIESETMLILNVALFSQHGTDPAVVFLQKIHEKPISWAPGFSSINSAIVLTLPD